MLVLGIYSYPALRTTRVTSSRVLPPISAPDLSLYLNISGIKTTSDGRVIDPYYGVPVSTARMGYLKFRLAFILFEYLHILLHTNLWWTLFLWNLFWWGFLCALAVWFFQQFLPDPSPVVVLAGIAFLMFFNFGILQGELAAWAHLPSWRGFQSVELAYIRPFFPQIPVPLLLLYLGLQIRALQKKSGWLWAAMAATQFVAFMIFPYAMLMMAGITAVSFVGQLVSRREPIPWLTLAAYALVCGLADLLFFFHGSRLSRTGAPGQYALIHLDLSMLPSPHRRDVAHLGRAHGAGIRHSKSCSRDQVDVGWPRPHQPVSSDRRRLFLRNSLTGLPSRRAISFISQRRSCLFFCYRRDSDTGRTGSRPRELPWQQSQRC